VTDDVADSARVLDPVDRNAEILFGLFMVLTFTGTLSVASAGRDDVRTMLIAAIGCNTAWGFVDGVMYVLRNLVVRGREATLERAIRGAATPADGQRLVAAAIGPLAAALDPPALESVRRLAVTRASGAAVRVQITAGDMKGALAVFLLVFASTFPVVLPFVFVADVQLAKRLSAAIAIAIMFRCGHQWGRYAGQVPWRAGLVLVVLGCAIEAIVIALGG
jgi:VIT1/CCC1 family predicted Fe2+/Mn2+ transporter